MPHIYPSFIIMTKATFRQLQSNSGGICRACGLIVEGGVEPDAEGYHCEVCGADAVDSVENLLVEGFSGIGGE